MAELIVAHSLAELTVSQSRVVGVQLRLDGSQLLRKVVELRYDLRVFVCPPGANSSEVDPAIRCFAEIT